MSELTLTQFARVLRKRPTKSEAPLWAQLRGRKLGVHPSGYREARRFRRQAVLGIYIVDFLAPCAKLVVEVDGAAHDSPDAREHDARRQADLERWFGVRFVRVRAELVERDALAAVAVVRAAL